jgi:lipid-A-disaccharide synthase
MIVAGEASGDRLGAELVRQMNNRRPGLRFYGTPGPEMRAAGVGSIFDSDAWSVVGIGAVARSIPKFLKILSTLRRSALERKPAAVILIDFPEFNLKLAKNLKKDGHRVIYYVSPQLWAWRKYRAKAIRDSVDLLLSILPFEKAWYREKGIRHVEYVGNPIISRTEPTATREDVFRKYGLENEKLIALLPGSRNKEIKRHLPVMLEAAKLIRKEFPTIQFVVPLAGEAARMQIEEITRSSDSVGAVIIEGDTINLLAAADVAAVASGTATLEAGIVGTPMAVVYRIPAIDYRVLKPFVSAPHIALINLIADRPIVKELIQNEFTAEKLAAEIVRLLDPEVNTEVRGELNSAVALLRSTDAPARAAEAVLNFIETGPL